MIAKPSMLVAALALFGGLVSAAPAVSVVERQGGILGDLLDTIGLGGCPDGQFFKGSTNKCTAYPSCAVDLKTDVLSNLLDVNLGVCVSLASCQGSGRIAVFVNRVPVCQPQSGTCAPNYIKKSTGECAYCDPAKNTIVNGKCEKAAIACLQFETRNSQTGKCDLKTCGRGKVLNYATGNCVDCREFPDGYNYDNGKCTQKTCKALEYFDKPTHKCRYCNPSTSKLEGGRCTKLTCQSGSVVNNGKCVVCPASTSYISNGKCIVKPKTCSGDFVLDIPTNTCICKNGLVLVDALNICVEALVCTGANEEPKYSPTLGALQCDCKDGFGLNLLGICVDLDLGVDIGI